VFNQGTCGFDSEQNNVASASQKGRYPSNTIFEHHPECKVIGTKEVKGDKERVRKVATEFFRQGGVTDTVRTGIGNNGIETVTEYECHADCPVKKLDEQSFKMGIHPSGNKGRKIIENKTGNIPFNTCNTKLSYGYGDKGGASRFFKQVEWAENEIPELFLYLAKASQSERNKGCEELEKGLVRNNMTTHNDTGNIRLDKKPLAVQSNIHPTVKPIALIEYLVKMFTKEGQLVLDPFVGSGTTGIACEELNRKYIVIERDPEYISIAKARIQHASTTLNNS